MKATSGWIAGFWLVAGAIMALNAGAQGSWTASCLLVALGIAAMLGAFDLLRRRALGWWVITGVNGLAAVCWAWGLASTYGVRRQEIEAVQDLMSASIMVLLALCSIGLILDRPSKWHSNESPKADC